MKAHSLRSPAAQALHERILAEWPQAIARWSSFLVLEEPILDASQEAIAQIHLGTRCVSLNDRLILQQQIEDCIPVMLAHELGHHVCYPGTLQVQARLKLMERTLLPDPECSLVNHFTDVMINERLGRTPELRAQMIRIYQADLRHSPGALDPLHGFYLGLYEALWDLPEGEILGSGAHEMRLGHPMYRADAALLSQDLFVLGPNLYTQFLYFLSVCLRYLISSWMQRRAMREALQEAQRSGGCQCGDPSVSDWGQAITPTQAEREAIRRAIEKGWFDKVQGDRLHRALEVGARISGLPGMGTEDASQVPAIMAAYYRQQAENLLFRPPAQPRIGEAVLPGVLEDWVPGDPVQEIDWRASWLRGEEIGPALPVRRIQEADREGEDVRFMETRMEIYLDVSGSMPNPCLNVNPMTLAAQILCTASIRAGGAVRVLLYSSQILQHWSWCRSETELSGFLMHYIGGGTSFPFEVLEDSIRELTHRQPIRVIITDHDFDANVAKESTALSLLAAAVKDSPGLILLQSGGDEASTRTYRRLGVRVVPVQELDSYPRLARELAWALFPEGPQ